MLHGMHVLHEGTPKQIVTIADYTVTAGHGIPLPASLYHLQDLNGRLTFVEQFGNTVAARLGRAPDRLTPVPACTCGAQIGHPCIGSGWCPDRFTDAALDPAHPINLADAALAGQAVTA